MMVPKKSLLLAGVALALFGAAASAQSGKILKNPNKSLKSYSLNMATGTITRGAAVNNRVGNTVQDFNNGGGRGLGVDTGAGFCEWFCVAQKGTGANQPGNQSDLMAQIRFAYCSSALDPTSGGPGGTVKLGFYNNYALGVGSYPAAPSVPAGTNGTTAAVFTVTGLPANTADACFFTFLNSGTGCITVMLTFGTQICFPDGNIAYSWKFTDSDPCNIFGSTMPFLSCVMSCSTNALGAGVPWPAGAKPIDGQGMTDFLDQYCPPGNLLKTFSFNTNTVTIRPMLTSINMRVRECADVAATLVAFNSTTPPNTDLFSSTKAILASTWTATTTRVGGTGGFWFMRVNDARSATANGTKCSLVSLPSATGRNMLAGSSLATFSGSLVGSIGVFSATIPCSPALLGFHWAAQSLVASGLTLRRCTSAVEGTVGTF